VAVSHVLSKIEPFFAITIQNLGRLDSKLISEDARFCSLSLDGRSTIEESAKLTDQILYSYLWILGLYELVRTFDKRCGSLPEFLSVVLKSKVKALKHKIERLRIPLAKMEPSERHKNTDYPIAYPAIHKELGVSWQVAKDIYISRRELSDETLSLFEEINGSSLA